MYFNTPEESDSTFDQIPDGEYRVLVNSHEDKATKSGSGTMAVIEFSIIGGDLHDRTIKKYFNITNQNPVAQRIGRAELKKFLQACGCTEPLADEAAFKRAVLNKVIYLTVEQKEKDGRTNLEIKKFSAQPEGQPSQGQDSNVAASGVPF